MMHVRMSWIGAAALSVVCSSSPVFETRKADAVKEALSPHQTINRAIDAMGGLEAVETIATARYVFEPIEPQSPYIRLAAHVRNAREFVLRTQSTRGLSAVGSDDVGQWRQAFIGSENMCCWSSDDVRAYEADIALLHRLVVNLLLPDVTVQPAELAVVDGRSAVTLRIDSDHRRAALYHFCEATGYLIAIDHRWIDDDGVTQGPRFLYRFWRNFGDIHLPTAIVEERVDGPALYWSLSTANFDVDVSEQLAVPDCVGELRRGPLVLDVDGDLVAAAPIMPGEITHARVQTMTSIEVRDALSLVARERSRARSRGDIELEDRLCQEWHWLLERLRQNSP